MPVLAAGTCNLLTIKSILTQSEYTVFKNAVINAAFNTAERADLFLVISKVATPSDLRALTTCLSNSDNLATWKVLRKNRGLNDINTSLLAKPDAIIAFAKIRRNPNRLGFGLTDDNLAKMQGWQFTNTGISKSFKEVIEQMESFIDVCKQNNITLDDGYNKVFKMFTTQSGTNKQGLFWIMEDIITNKTFFKDRTLNFEVGTPNARPTIRDSRIDVVTDHDENPFWIEYKWLESATVEQELFISEFIERDLFSIPSLSQLQWRIKGKKLTKEKVIQYLQSTEGRDALKQLSGERASLLLKNINLSNANASDIADAFIAHFGVQSNFDKIFK